MQTHLEPLAEEARDGAADEVAATRRPSTRDRPRRDRRGAATSCASCTPTRGSSRYLTLALDSRHGARRRARAREPRSRSASARERPEIADVVVHTEPPSRVRLCMFSPREQELERGWPGRIDGDASSSSPRRRSRRSSRAAATRASTREYPLAEVVLRAPVLHPPSIRVFDGDGDFVFANPAAIHGPEDARRAPRRRRCDRAGGCASRR